MSTSQLSTPEELRGRLAAERAGFPFLVFRTAAGRQQIVALRDRSDRVTIGRALECDVHLELDPEVSRVHAQLEELAGNWLLSDDGLSRNGTFVNGERLTGRCRLVDGDILRCGSTSITFHDPLNAGGEATRPAGDAGPARLTPTQRRVLVALCRPLRDGNPYALPATNRDIADELVVTTQAVKAQLRGLFGLFGIDALPHNQKRLRLARHALESGSIAISELRECRARQ